MKVERRRIREEISLILPAIFIAVVVWVIAKQQKLETNWVDGLPITVVNIPANMDVVRNPADVRIQVRYPAEMHNSVVARNFSLEIDATKMFRTEPEQIRPQEIKFQVAPRLIEKHNLPETIQVVQADPPEIKLVASLRVTTASIQAVTVGQLPRNLELTGKPQPRPAQVVVTGSIEALRQLSQQHNRIQTTPIDLTQIQASGVVYPKLVLPAGIQLVARTNREVSVDIGLTEKMIKRIYESVPVTVALFKPNIEARLKPESISIEVEGPDTALRQLTNDDFEVLPVRDPAETLGQVQTIGIEAHTKSVASGAQVRVVRCIPNSIDVQFVPKTQPKPAPSATPRTGRR